jgi:formylmethanofuran dehydrogenase subunit A
LLVGALIWSILVPSSTRQWQNHEKELEMKSGLVEDINNSVTDFVMAVQFAEVGVTSQSQADYDKAGDHEGPNPFEKDEYIKDSLHSSSALS